MPALCCVPGCGKRTGGHLFPTDSKLFQRWVVAIRRNVSSATGKRWLPSEYDVICKDHFSPEDYVSRIYDSKKMNLKAGVVPTKFKFKNLKAYSLESEMPSTSKTRSGKEFPATVENLEPLDDVNEEIEIVHNVIDCSDIDEAVQCDLVDFVPTFFSLIDVKRDSKAMQYYTGFKDYEHFKLFYQCLGRAATNLVYHCSTLNPEEELFITLMKLRQAKDNKEISILFKISEGSVSKILNTWINFLYFQLRELNIWPSKTAIDQHMPTQFKRDFSSTRIILDATEVPVDKLRNVTAQSVTFSSYKNRNTLKVMVGISPIGLVTYVSDAYGGSASDRQIMEKSDLYLNGEQLFSPGDSIMADRGILVQDLFSSHDVKVNTPTMLKGKHQLDAIDVVKDRRIASRRIHVERVIGLAKTYKILKQSFTPSLTPLCGRIIFVC